MRVLRSIVQPLMLPVVYSFQDLLHGGTIDFEFVSDDNPGSKTLRHQQFVEKLVGCLFIPTALHQYIEYLAILIAARHR